VNGSESPKEVEHVKAFKVSAANFTRSEFDESELKDIVATLLDYKLRHIDKRDSVQDLHEHIEFEVPSAISLMHIILEYLMKRVEKLGVVKAEQSNLFVALDEAFVNAVKHGNKFDAKKLVRIIAEVSSAELALRSRTKAKASMSIRSPILSTHPTSSKPPAAASCSSTTSWTK
jgi:bifunctional DNase/RNase